MILPVLILVLVAGALVSIAAAKVNSNLPRYIALLALAINVVLLLGSWNLSAFPTLFQNGNWMYAFKTEWIPTIGASIDLRMDGLSFLMILLTLIMGFIAVMASPKTEDEGFYYFNTLLMIAGVTGIFLAFDLLLFFFFWEMMLVPLYLLMVMFGKDKSSRISVKFLIYTQASGLLMLFSILCMYIIKGKLSGTYSFEYDYYLLIPFGIPLGSVLVLGFLAAFFVKLPVFPFHGWLPGTFVEAPVTAVITGLLIKTGAYGLIRFALPFFPDVSALFANTAMLIGIVTILYGAFMAFTQTDLRLIAAYSGISHMGFIILGLYSFNEIAWQGVVIQMIASAISTSALVLIASALIKRTGTCNIDQLGGLWEKVPTLSGLGVFFAMAALGLPGMGNFIAEYLILAGTFKVSAVSAIIASLGLIVAAAYSLRIIQKVFVGNKNNDWEIIDFTIVEKLSLGTLVILILWIGLNPQPILNRSKATIEKVLNTKQSGDKEIPSNVNKNEASVKVNLQ
jgi:NADH-quinone oxidoreductase subunit M